MTNSVEVDLLIVGAGPVGLYGAFYAGVRGLRVAVVDSLSEVGGQVAALYPEKLIYDIAALPAVKGRDLVNSLLEQAAPYAPVYLLDQEAQTFERAADGCVVTTSAGTTVRCGAVVVTGGIGTFTPRALAAGTEHVGRGLAYFVPDPAVHAGADVIVVGGGDSALDWALMLEPIAASVTLVHRRAEFRAHAATVAAAHASSIRIVTDAQVTELHGETWLERATVRIDSPAGPVEQVLACSAVIAALGFKANLGPLRAWGADLHDNRHFVVDSAMRTTVAGLYAAGDITDYDGKVRLISVGFGEVATAVNNAAVFIDPAAALFPGHSSDLETPALVSA
ncbi:NAD(P)/FAD-dependent oxidoreductase [uncultured Jatrophihabitans sp.]|uniref:NAD(P)/FAD-dependent oxidoreductase n=1 Tax=uncultured Jatrophihabitans sp. TaxID=1610747 RepID=UPI0035CC6E99